MLSSLCTCRKKRLDEALRQRFDAEIEKTWQLAARDRELCDQQNTPCRLEWQAYDGRMICTVREWSAKSDGGFGVHVHAQLE